MKTAVSVPDVTFEAATAQAAAMGISRSEFFTRAAERYLRQLDDESLTARINAAIEETGLDGSDDGAVWAGHRELANTEW